MNIHYFQHAPFEGLGCIEPWARVRRHHIGRTRLYEGDPFPAPRGVDLLFVMGGPMGVHDNREYAWLAAEKRAIEAMIKAGKPVIGICLGAQLLADVLGARIFANKYREIGWFPVTATPDGVQSTLIPQSPPHCMAFHWHNDTFDIPAGALHIARSDACENQAFIYEQRVLGLQFHLEATREGVRSLAAACEHEIQADKPYVQTVREMESDETRFQKAHARMRTMLEQFLCDARQSAGSLEPCL